jgi:ferrous iron transport protein A
LTLDSMPIGKTAKIESVGGEGALRLRLLDMGLIPGTEVTVQKTAPLGDPLEISVRGYQLTIRKDDARLLSVREENK